MVFRSKLSRPPKEAAKAAPEPIPERKRTAETLARKTPTTGFHGNRPTP
jgi:hypothetical protein